MIFAMASQIDPHTRRLIQRVEDFNNTLTECEKRMEVMLDALEREAELHQPLPSSASSPPPPDHHMVSQIHTEDYGSPLPHDVKNLTR